MHPILLRDQTEGESPEVWYSAYRYMDRMFSERRDHRVEEIASLDLSRLSLRMRYLMRNLLILQRRYAEMLDTYPNLRGLEDREVREMTPEPPILLTDPPRGTWSFLTRKGILL